MTAIAIASEIAKNIPDINKVTVISDIAEYRASIKTLMSWNLGQKSVRRKKCNQNHIIFDFFPQILECINFGHLF